MTSIVVVFFFWKRGDPFTLHLYVRWPLSTYEYVCYQESIQSDHHPSAEIRRTLPEEGSNLARTPSKTSSEETIHCATTAENWYRAENRRSIIETSTLAADAFRRRLLALWREITFLLSMVSLRAVRALRVCPGRGKSYCSEGYAFTVAPLKDLNKASVCKMYGLHLIVAYTWFT